MRFMFTSLTVVAVLGVAACANNPNRPTDVGSMQTPAPSPVGIAVPGHPGVDTGSVQPPPRTGGLVRGAPAARDTGSMALPNAAQGNSAPGRY